MLNLLERAGDARVEGCRGRSGDEDEEVGGGASEAVDDEHAGLVIVLLAGVLVASDEGQVLDKRALHTIL